MECIADLGSLLEHLVEHLVQQTRASARHAGDAARGGGRPGVLETLAGSNTVAELPSAGLWLR
jgi:hypothetical protein